MQTIETATFVGNKNWEEVAVAAAVQRDRRLDSATTRTAHLGAAALATILVGLSFWPTAGQAAMPPGCRGSFHGTQFADVDGDGRADAIVVNTEGIAVRLSNGKQFLRSEVWSEIPYFGEQWSYSPFPHSFYADPGATQFSDVDGDGRADAIVVNGSNITVRLSDGQKFLLPNQAWTIDPYFGSRGTFFADVTADGMADAIKLSDTHVGVRVSNGPASVFLLEQNWTSVPYYGDYGTYFADVDGDGAADAIAVNHAFGIAVRRAYFASVFPPPQFLAHELWTSLPVIGSVGDYFADVTGDGTADAIVVNDTGVTVRPSDGTRFGAAEAWTDVPYFGDAYPTCIN